ncbi:MAG: ASCH domain-containing protein [Sneathiella sp.]|uniref:ASCH domain-containing protein n=1 Tax=Sneathiella sp. TaxID=1964365 RepID=UPI0030031117
MDQNKSNLTEKYWSTFVTATGIEGHDYAVVTFGNTKALAETLLALVLSGKKRATASLLTDYSGQDVPLPKVGDYVVVLDGSSAPNCIWRTTDVTVKPFNEVDEIFAWAEGEGDRSLDFWLSTHRAYFTLQCHAEGFEMHDHMETVFEKFEIVWPLEVEDPIP